MPSQNKSAPAISQYALRAWLQEVPARERFEREMFSQKIIEVLLACGIYDPKCLLRMTRKQIAAIPGIGKAAMARIDDYRQAALTKGARP